MTSILKAFVWINVLAIVRAATYSRTNSITGSGFLSAFSVQSEADPTHGRVNYVNAATAASLNLTYANGNTFILRSDFTTTLSSSGPGRNSVRMQSNQAFGTSVMVFNVRHMPEGCGTWPAVWTVGPNWPSGGEVDIIEGVNNVSPNQVTLHTSPGCTMPSSRSELGTAVLNDCNTQANSNSGCGVKVSGSNSYGPGFNANGGGWYAVERTSSFIKVWFWPRGASGIPSDAMNGATSVNTANWGTPQAFFPNTDCSISSMFAPQNIVINLTFCGDWAGQSSIYSSSGCPSTCVDYVNNNPSAFRNAYFDFASLNIYQ